LGVYKSNQLATSFNTMKNNLQGLVIQASQTWEQVAASSDELMEVANHLWCGKYDSW